MIDWSCPIFAKWTYLQPTSQPEGFVREVLRPRFWSYHHLLRSWFTAEKKKTWGGTITSTVYTMWALRPSIDLPSWRTSLRQLLVMVDMASNSGVELTATGQPMIQNRLVGYMLDTCWTCVEDICCINSYQEVTRPASGYPASKLIQTIDNSLFDKR